MTWMKIGLFLVLACALVVWVLRNDIYLPVEIVVQYESHAPKGLTAYIDTGKGFNEEETLRFRGARFSADERRTGIWLGPPILNLRLDPGYRPVTIVLDALCLDSLVKKTCWTASELYSELIPANDIANIALKEGSLHVTSGGPDPYLLFGGGFLGRYAEHARVAKRYSIPLAALLPLLLIWAWAWSSSVFAALAKRLARPAIHMTWYQSLGVFVLVALIATGNWLQLDDAGVSAGAILMGFAVLMALPRGTCAEPAPVGRLIRNIRGDGALAAALAVFSAAAPVFALLVLTWGQEFPYVGDQHFHLDIDRATYFFVMGHLPELAFVLASLLLCMLLGWVRAWIVAAAGFFVLWSYTEAVPQYFVRYPGAGRFFAAPFFHLAESHRWDSLLNAARLANASAILVWLLVLRPLIVRRWPDWSITPVAAAFFFQLEVVYYFTSSYLEPWSLIFVLLAVEQQIRWGHDPARAGAAMLLIGVAAVVKEAAIFMLPLIWLAGSPWRHGRRHLLRSCVIAVAAALPFLIYFLIRNAAGERPFRMVEPDQFVTAQKLVETYYQFDFHFGPGGLLLCAALLLLLVISAFKPSRRAGSLMLLGGVLFYLAYNYLEATSIGYAGYSRYYLFPYLLLCAGLLYLRWPGKPGRTPSVACAAAAAAAALNTGVLLPYLDKARGNDAVRNFTEHYDAAVFLPIRELIEAAENTGLLKEGAHVVVNNRLGWGMPSIGINYPDLARRFDLRVEDDLPCVCGEDNRVILQPFVFMGGLNAHLRLPQLRRDRQQFPKKHFYEIWADHDGQKPACLISMNATCRSVLERREQSELIGILGIP